MQQKQYLIDILLSLKNPYTKNINYRYNDTDICLKAFIMIYGITDYQHKIAMKAIKCGRSTPLPRKLCLKTRNKQRTKQMLGEHSVLQGTSVRTLYTIIKNYCLY